MSSASNLRSCFRVQTHFFVILDFFLGTSIVYNTLAYETSEQELELEQEAFNFFSKV